MPNTIELIRDIRDRPARRLLAWGIWLLAVGVGLGTIPSLVLTGRIDHTVWGYIHDITGPMFMTMRALGGILIAGAVIVRVMLKSHEETRQELREEVREHSVDAEAIGRVVALLESLTVNLSDHRERLREAWEAAKQQREADLATAEAVMEGTVKRVMREAYAAGYTDALAGANGSGRPVRLVPPPS